MQNVSANYVLIGLGIVAIVVELLLGVATGFDLFLAGLSLILGGIIGMVSGSFTVGLISTVILIFLYIFLGRKFIKNKLHIETQATNVEGIMGKQAMVVKEITPDEPGQVKVEGEIWRARASKTLAKGELVVVKSVSGVTLEVGT